MDHSYIDKNLANVRKRINTAAERTGRDVSSITMLAAIKSADVNEINHLTSRLGVTVVGENRVQQLTERYDKIEREGLEIHFIGSLQTNKVKYIIDKVCMIHSLDSLKLAAEIDKQAKKHGLVARVLLEINSGGEESKGGISVAELPELARLACELEHVALRGLMAIPPISHEPGANIPYFSTMHQLFVDIKEKMSDNQNRFLCLSMGMSGDFEAAIACGSNMIRVGTAIFGQRSYPTK